METYVNQREMVEKTFLIDVNGKFKIYKLLWDFGRMQGKAQFKCFRIMATPPTKKI